MLALAIRPNETVEGWNKQHEENNRLMSWDELTELVK